jgi:DNA-binding NarL/FixJ family response regulator
MKSYPDQAPSQDQKAEIRGTGVQVCIMASHPLAIQCCRDALCACSEFSVTLVKSDQKYPSKAGLSRPLIVYIVDLASQMIAGRLLLVFEMLREKCSDARILAIGEPLSPGDISELLPYGLHGYISYPELNTQLELALRAMQESRLWFAPEVLQCYAHRMTISRVPREENWKRFTSTEKKVLHLLCQRLSNKEIGAVMGVSERTVRFHLGNLFIKLGVNDRYTLIDMVSYSATGSLSRYKCMS